MNMWRSNTDLCSFYHNVMMSPMFCLTASCRVTYDKHIYNIVKKEPTYASLLKQTILIDLHNFVKNNILPNKKAKIWRIKYILLCLNASHIEENNLERIEHLPRIFRKFILLLTKFQTNKIRMSCCLMIFFFSESALIWSTDPFKYILQIVQ